MSVDRHGPDVASAPERMTRVERRDQLLDTAAEIVAEAGFNAVTMEGVASRGGVSKALPYTHFGNADELIAALRDREIAILTRRTVAAVLSADTFQDKIEAAIHVVFESVKDRGNVLVSFLRWLPQFESKVHEPPPPTPFDWFLADMFEAEANVPRPVARTLQRVLGMGIIGAIDAWTEGHASRAEAEQALVKITYAGALALGLDTRPVARRRRPGNS
jgi:AcrR family transcriptional regulator